MDGIVCLVLETSGCEKIVLGGDIDGKLKRTSVVPGSRHREEEETRCGDKGRSHLSK